MLQLQTDKQCSKCGAINNFEVAYEKTKENVFCTECGNKTIVMQQISLDVSEPLKNFIELIEWGKKELAEFRFIPPHETTEKF